MELIQCAELIWGRVAASKSLASSLAMCAVIHVDTAMLRMTPGSQEVWKNWQAWKVFFSCISYVVSNQKEGLIDSSGSFAWVKDLGGEVRDEK